MNEIKFNGEELTLGQLWQISMENAKVVIDEKSFKIVDRSREIVDRAIQKNQIIYGITTGFGKLSDIQISPKDITQLQINLLRSHCAGVGRPAPPSVCRAMMALKLNNLLRGFSGVRREVIIQLQEFLNRGILPVIPSKGSAGASGDLAPLAHMSLVLIGEGEVKINGESVNGAEVLKKFDLQPIELQAKEGLSLINGTQYMTAIAALVVFRAKWFVKTADIIAAMTVDGMKATPVAFDSRIQAIRNQVGQMESAQNLTALIAGSEIRLSHVECSKIQDAYSIRCIPQVHGSCRDAIRYVSEIVEREINAVTDNPIVFPVEGEIVSGGNFHGAPISMVLDFLAIAIAEYASISERRIALMMDSNFSELTDFLTPKPGLNCGFMLAQVTAASLVSENKTLCHPASIDTIPTSANKEDHVSMGANAANKMLQVLENTENVLAIELLCAAQSIDLRAPLLPGNGITKAHNHLRNKVSFLDQDRILSKDIEIANNLISSFSLVQEVEKEIQMQ
ncbi:histidine ammonia-lyase [candidate division KSB1 bacterium]|nr:histidine ammonia-lyase [candidate division KSB1 bacterium]